MSLLGRQVFANPNTPLWGTEGPGPQDETFQTIRFTPQLPGDPVESSTIKGSSPAYANTNRIGIFDGSGNLGPLQVGGEMEVQAVGPATNAYDRMLYGYDGIDYQQSNTGTSVSFLSINSGKSGWELSNITAINGQPYNLLPGTVFSYSNYPGGAPIAEPPNWTVLNAQSFTAPQDGKVYVESLGTYVSTVLGGTTVMNFAINGVDAPVEAAKTQGYNSNINFIGTTMYQFPVSAGLTYDISSIAQCSALPPAGADSIVTSSRMFLLFSPQ